MIRWQLYVLKTLGRSLQDANIALSILQHHQHFLFMFGSLWRAWKDKVNPVLLIINTGLPPSY